MQTEDESLTPNPAWKVAFVLVPVFLVLSSAVAMWLWWREAEDPAPDPRLALAATEVSAAELDDHLRKMGELIGPRDWETPAGRKSLHRAVAFIEGTLSPQNYGFAVRKGAHLTLFDERWPTLWVDLPGSGSSKEVVLVAAPYDRSEAAVAVALAAINDLRDEVLERRVRFVFFPEGLYRAEDGRGVTKVLEGGEVAAATLHPALPGDPSGMRGSDLVPVAQALVDKVRATAAGAGKMP